MGELFEEMFRRPKTPLDSVEAPPPLRLCTVVGETGRCNAPLHGAPVGWGFVRKPSKIAREHQSVLPPSDGAAVPMHCLSTRARITNRLLVNPSQKLRKERALPALLRPKSAQEGSMVNKVGGCARQPGRPPAIPPALL